MIRVHTHRAGAETPPWPRDLTVYGSDKPPSVQRAAEGLWTLVVHAGGSDGSEPAKETHENIPYDTQERILAKRVRWSLLFDEQVRIELYCNGHLRQFVFVAGFKVDPPPSQSYTPEVQP